MIRMQIPWLPPSANHAYFNLPRGGRTLTTEGKKFKRETAAYLVQTYPTELQFFKPNVPYGVGIQFIFPELENKTWPGKATTRYKKVDTSNRVKLLEDVLGEVANIDDSQHVTLLIGKTGGESARTDIWVWDKPGQINDVISEFQFV